MRATAPAQQIYQQARPRSAARDGPEPCGSAGRKSGDDVQLTPRSGGPQMKNALKKLVLVIVLAATAMLATSPYASACPWFRRQRAQSYAYTPTYYYPAGYTYTAPATIDTGVAGTSTAFTGTDAAGAANASTGTDAGGATTASNGTDTAGTTTASTEDKTLTPDEEKWLKEFSEGKTAKEKTDFEAFWKDSTHKQRKDFYDEMQNVKKQVEDELKTKAN
jgi:hypothetical protein